MTVRIRGRNGRWQYDIHTSGPAGPVHERRNVPDVVKSESGATRWAAAREQHLVRNGQEEETEPAPTLAAFGERWLREYAKANQLKPSTQAAYESRFRLHLEPSLGSTRIDMIGEVQVQRLKLALDGKSAKTVHGVLALLEEVLHTAERWNEIVRAPKFDKPTVSSPPMEFFDFAEWSSLMAGARLAGAMETAYVLLGGDAGLRRGEIVALEHADVSGAMLTVARNEWQGIVDVPKGGRIRHVPLTERLREAIAAVRHLRGKRMLWQTSGRRVGIPTLQSWLEKACRRAGLPASRNIHKLRHTFGAHLAMRGAPAKAIQELMGHADLATTMRYMHLAKGSLAAAVATLEMPHGGGTGAVRDGAER